MDIAKWKQIIPALLETCLRSLKPLNRLANLTLCNMSSPTQMHSYCQVIASTSGPLSYMDRQAAMQLGFQLSFLDIPESTSTLYKTQTSSGRIIYLKHTYHCRQVLTYPFSSQLLKLPTELVEGMIRGR
ncbi:hypothetical protein KIL84_018061 [Mauremys mutica]|uniref:Uncharacterized protein n=1 Tax=Mauremys mutica TaxID=74926 RepID=A0A9D3XT00_9SAUR|nr:hypothetical protein KIL84_018061 [Mauremys mutica]